MVDIEFLKAVIAKRLKEARRKRGYSQEEIGKMLGLGKGAYGSFERGRNLIALNHLLELARIYGEPVASFFPSLVSETELNDLSHDPLFAELASYWPNLTVKDKDALMVFIRIMAAKRRGE